MHTTASNLRASSGLNRADSRRKLSIRGMFSDRLSYGFLNACSASSRKGMTCSLPNFELSRRRSSISGRRKLAILFIEPLQPIMAGATNLMAISISVQNAPQSSCGRHTGLEKKASADRAPWQSPHSHYTELHCPYTRCYLLSTVNYQRGSDGQKQLTEVAPNNDLVIEVAGYSPCK